MKRAVGVDDSSSHISSGKEPKTEQMSITQGQEKTPHQFDAALLRVAFESSPVLLAVLDGSNKFLLVNPLFEAQMGPFSTFAELAFDDSGFDDECKEKLASALKSVREEGIVVKVRDANMITMAGPGGFPVARHFDWSLKLGADSTTVSVSGEVVTEDDEQQREKDAEILDFLQNAPIAMHWLSGTGIVLWANNTELRMLGYSAEEYIGQPIMKFCPDEEELVLEIFKQLGSGNSIKDMPVRFRAKDGRIVPLLIDSNVNYTKAGEFNHTRCFIRDDTQRKVREANAEVLLKETQRTLELFDAFASRTIHLVRTPCHLLLANLEEAEADLSGDMADLTPSANARNSVQGHLFESTKLVREIVAMTSDFSDSMRFEQGAVLVARKEPVNLQSEGKRALAAMLPLVNGKEVELVLEFQAGGGSANTDPEVLSRILGHLLRNAVQATTKGSVTLQFLHSTDSVTVAVLDTGKGILAQEALSFERYGIAKPFTSSNQTAPSTAAKGDKGAAATPEAAEAERDHIASKLALSSCTYEGMGVGLSLSYALTQSLGAELRYESRPGATRFWFNLSRSSGECGKEVPLPVIVKLNAEYVGSSSTDGGIDQESLLALQSVRAKSQASQQRESREFKEVGAPNLTPSAADVASKGVFEANLSPHVLVVEDSKMCAKMLVNKLKRLGCTAEVAEDGSIAVEMLKESAPCCKFNLVLMDIRMPVMDGYEATRIAKKELKLLVPIVAVSAETGAEMKTHCDEVGFDSTSAKPLDNNQLAALLEQYIPGDKS